MKSRHQEIKINNTYSNWTVTSLPFLDGKFYKVSCQCTCGKTKKVKTHNLLSGKSKSCGCIQQKALVKNLTGKPSKHRVSAAVKAINQIHNSYKFGAKKRSLSFSLTKSEFTTLLQQECSYCGKLNSNLKNNINGSFTYNGIDRVDSNIGYELYNVVACCSTCNMMKNDLPLNEFYEHLRAIKTYTTKDLFKITERKLNYLHAKATAVAAASHDIHTKVGAIVLDAKTGAVLAEGYNGFVRHAPDITLPTSRPEKYDYMVHAEMNALCHAGRQGTKVDDSILYTTLSPCKLCLRLMWQAGIKDIYFKEKYKDFEECTSMLDLKVYLNQIGDFYHMVVNTHDQAKSI